MFTLFFGNDTIAVRTRAHEKVREYESAGTAVARLGVENFVRGTLRDMAGSASLFAGTQVTLIDTLSDDVGAFKELLRDAEVLVASENIFIGIESTLSADAKRQLTAAGVMCAEHTGEKEERFNSFLLADALLSRDRRALWFLLMRARRHGVKTEEIIGTLFWQLKMLRLAEKTKSAEEAEQKSFVYSKAKRALGKFKKGETEALSRSLLSLYHDGHSGRRDIDLALERWTLTL